MPSEKPIIFNTENVRAILEGRKTQTRRVIKPQPLSSYLPDSDLIKRLKAIPQHTLKLQDKDDHAFIHIIPKCPYGQVGDLLWVKETCLIVLPQGMGEVIYRADCDYKDEDLSPVKKGHVILKWRPSIFIPRWASRITLEITEIRVERVQEITPQDCLAEGIAPCKYTGYTESYKNNDYLIGHFANLWDSINAKRGYPWASNPWVWCVSFKKQELPG